MGRALLGLAWLLIAGSPATCGEREPGDGGWWAVQPLERPPVPEVRRAAWVRNPIDSFILARLEAEGLEPAPPAPREVLLRRLALDLTGLPPSPEEAAAFLGDEA